MADGWHDGDVADGGRSGRSRLVTILIVVAALVVAVVGLRWIMFAAYTLPSETMEPTFAAGDRILVNQLDTGPGRGDVVVYVVEDDPGRELEVIGRVIAFGGETIAATDGVVTIDGAELSEPYLEPGMVTFDFDPVTVPSGQLFIMGDSRDMSLDSRFRGPVPEASLIGTVVARACCPPALL